MSLEGRLEDLGIGDIFQIIGLSNRSGVLTLIRKEGSARMVFSQGQVVYASSDTRNRLGATLVQKGIVSNEDLEYALRIQKGRGSSKPMGAILIEMGAINQEILEREIRLYIIQVTHDLLGWDRGSFYFELGHKLEDAVVLKNGLGSDFLLMEATRIRDEESRSQSEPEPAQPEAKIAVPDDLEKAQMVRPPASPPVSSLPPPESAPQPVVVTKPPEVHQSVQDPEKSISSSGDDSPSLQERKDLRLLTSMISELSGPTTSSEITLLILRFASELMNRAVLLLVRKDDIVGLGQFGLNLPDDSPQERVRSIRIPLAEPSLFKDVVDKKSFYKTGLTETKWHQYFINKLGEGWPTQVFLAPIICNGQVIAIMYGDDVPNKADIPETEGLEAFIKVSGFAFGKALLERKLQEAQS